MFRSNKKRMPPWWMSLEQKPWKYPKFVVCVSIFSVCGQKHSHAHTHNSSIRSRRLVRDPIVAVVIHRMRLAREEIEAAYSEETVVKKTKRHT